MSKFRLLPLPSLAVGLVLALAALGLVHAQQGGDEEKNQGKEKPAKAAGDNAELAAQVKEIFRDACFECHGAPGSAASRVKVLDRENLLKRKKVKPNKPGDSELLQLILADDATVMPPKPRPKLSPDKIELVRAWIDAGAPAFPPDVARPVEKAEEKDKSFKDNPFVKEVVGVDYVLKKVLAHVRATRMQDRRYIRYFSINHILTVAGATPQKLEEYRDAFVKAINHLTWEANPVRPIPVDPPYNTIFAVDIRKLGWHIQPYNVWGSGGAVRRSRLNLYDLVLLEYPYAAIYEDSETFDYLLTEYMEPAHLARPIPYVRIDWFCSVITQPPLYEDMMLMPYTVQELEYYLGVDVKGNQESYKARRAGMTVSDVSRNNRVVERHPLGKGAGAYWKSFDFKSSKGFENMFKDPLGFREAGGEFIFNLPNGLQGYYVADAKGERIELAPTDIVKDKFASDATVRNGLACIRCHDKGMKPVEDDIRPALLKLPSSELAFDRRLALELYAPKKEMDELLEEDTRRFVTSLERVLGKPQKKEPLVPVSEQFLDKPLSLPTAAGELGLSDPKDLMTVFRMPGFSTLGLAPLGTGKVIRRDAWEDYYDGVVRALGLGVPVVPLDGLIRQDFPAGRSDVKVELKTNGKGNVFAPGDKMIITVTNKSDKTVYIELIGTGTRGRKYILADSKTMIKPGQSYRWPPTGPGQEIKGRKGKELITVLASFKEFPAGQLLRGVTKHGQYVTDRVYHPFYRVSMDRGRPRIENDARSMVKRTIEIETK